MGIPYRTTFTLCIPAFDGFRSISWAGRTPSTRSSISTHSPGSETPRRDSIYLSSSSSSVKSNNNNNSSSLSLILDLTKAKLQDIVDAKKKSERQVPFTNKFVLDLPENISQDKSELDYLRRINAEAAAAAQAKKDTA